MCGVKQVKNLFTDLKYKMQADRFVLLYKFEIFFPSLESRTVFVDVILAVNSVQHI